MRMVDSGGGLFPGTDLAPLFRVEAWPGQSESIVEGLDRVDVFAEPGDPLGTQNGHYVRYADLAARLSEIVDPREAWDPGGRVLRFTVRAACCLLVDAPAVSALIGATRRRGSEHAPGSSAGVAEAVQFWDEIAATVINAGAALDLTRLRAAIFVVHDASDADKPEPVVADLRNWEALADLHGVGPLLDAIHGGLTAAEAGQILEEPNGVNRVRVLAALAV